MSNLAIWDALGKTDPKHTKQFSRAGGFQGTAIKPQWAIHKLTEYFGPCGYGWGVGEPSFQVVPAGNETLVYCTVKCWYDLDGICDVYGVGGDKVLTVRKSGPFIDDEAFKKAFTDAIMNAFKFVGVGADIHMGLFDDSKYVREVAAEYAEAKQTSVVDAPVAKAPAPSQPRVKLTGPHMTVAALREAAGTIKSEVHAAADYDALDAYLVSVRETIDQIKRDKPDWWTDPGYGLDAEIAAAYIRIEKEREAA